MKLKYMAMAIAAMLMASCTDQDYMELDKGSTELALTASASEVTLTEASHTSTPLELKWTSGTNYGTGNRITYTLELAVAGTGYADTFVPLADVTQEYTWSPTAETLNDILIDRLGLEPGTPALIDARITATVAEMAEPQIAETTFSVTPYSPVTSTLYLIGSAAPNGWSADNATELTRSDNGIFTWTGQLNAGEFKFITVRGQFLPSYNATDDGHLVYRASDNEPDGKFNITDGGYYRVDVNLLTLTIVITPVQGVTREFEELYFVGEMTDWNFEAMIEDPLDMFVFKYGRFFVTGGEFKFGTQSGSWENMFKATQANAPYTDTSMELIKGFDPDNKWLLQTSEAGKAYRIWVDTRNGQQRMLMREFTPFTEMYLVGDATPNGWDLGNATPMTLDASDPYIFTWSGHLNTGELKFSADKQDDWNGAWYLAAKENAEPTGSTETAIFINKSDNWFAELYTEVGVGDVDRKWRITEAGNYTITLNQLLDQITIIKD